MTEKINSFPDFSSAFNDSRIDKRAKKFISTFSNSRKATISKLSGTHAEQKANYRLLENTKFSEDIIKSRTFVKCNENSKRRHVLAITDTVDFNLDSHKGRVDLAHGFGLASNATIGFKLHSTLIIDAQNYFPIGFSSIDIWNRDFEQPLKGARKYQNTSIEEKESHKWIKAIDNTKKHLSNAESITFVADRESDMYDVLAKPRNDQTHFVLRSKSDRNLNSGIKLHSFLAKSLIKFEYKTKIEGDIRKKSSTREVTLRVKYETISITKPTSCKNKTLAHEVTINVIEVTELTNKKEKIHWLLYTTRSINSVEEAMQIIEWYRARWNIEQIHRLLKTEGLEIEKTQLEKAESIKKLIVLALTATLRIMQMHIAYHKELEQDISSSFDKTEQDLLIVINNQVEGKTKKLKNPFKKTELRWATWIIARLGDWKGYQKQRPPGVTTLQKGLIKFYNMMDGWTLAHQILVGKR